MNKRADTTEWWKVEGDEVYIYTEKTREVRKTPYHNKCLMGSYHDKGLKAYQYRTYIDSSEWKEFVNILGLSEKNRHKERRK